MALLLRTCSAPLPVQAVLAERRCSVDTRSCCSLVCVAMPLGGGPPSTAHKLTGILSAGCLRALGAGACTHTGALRASRGAASFVSRLPPSLTCRSSSVGHPHHRWRLPHDDATGLGQRAPLLIDGQAASTQRASGAAECRAGGCVLLEGCRCGMGAGVAWRGGAGQLRDG